MTDNVHLMCGVPGSGKSFYAKNLCAMYEDDGKSTVIISRDEIRKSLVGANVDNDHYFSREKEVFTEFVRQINDAIKIGINEVFIDATHINEASRRKILRCIEPNTNTNLIAEVRVCDLQVALERNAQRTGFARVPDDAIRRMYADFKEPTIIELMRYDQFKSVYINRGES